MNGMNSNPLFSDQETSPPVSPRLSSSTSSSDLDDDVPAVTPPASVLQTINIKSHVPIVLDLANPNYAQWRSSSTASSANSASAPTSLFPPPPPSATTLRGM